MGGFGIRIWAIVIELGEDEIGQDSTKGSSYGCLTIEETEAAGELEAGVEKGEVGDGNWVETS